MHWNHRVMNCPSENGGEDWFTFKEVFYDEDNKPNAYCDMFVGSESLGGLQEMVERLTTALGNPVLHEKEFQHGSNAG